jgi:hypothetical protein
VRWVVDGAAINRVARDSSNYNYAFAHLTDLVNASELTFCDQVVAELERTAEGDPGLLWADTVKALRSHSTAPYTTQRWVLANVDDVVDPDDRYDAAPYVVAQAKALRDTGNDQLAVVTEDLADKPTRRALADICDELEIPWVEVPDMMAASGFTWP